MAAAATVALSSWRLLHKLLVVLDPKPLLRQLKRPAGRPAAASPELERKVLLSLHPHLNLSLPRARAQGAPQPSPSP